jgi:hypothetical protein
VCWGFGCRSSIDNLDGTKLEKKKKKSKKRQRETRCWKESRCALCRSLFPSSPDFLEVAVGVPVWRLRLLGSQSQIAWAGNFSKVRRTEAQKGRARPCVESRSVSFSRTEFLFLFLFFSLVK